MKKTSESKNPKFLRTKNGRIMLLSKCAMCDSEKSKFIKEKRASGLLRSFSKIRLFGPLLFQ